jgi:hypothetical protein
LPCIRLGKHVESGSSQNATQAITHLTIGFGHTGLPGMLLAPFAWCVTQRTQDLSPTSTRARTLRGFKKPASLQIRLLSERWAWLSGFEEETP